MSCACCCSSLLVQHIFVCVRCTGLLNDLWCVCVFLAESSGAWDGLSVRNGVLRSVLCPQGMLHGGGRLRSQGMALLGVGPRPQGLALGGGGLHPQSLALPSRGPRPQAWTGGAFVSMITKSYPVVFELLSSWVRQALPLSPCFPFASISVNYNYATRMHGDSNNARLSSVFVIRR